MCEPIVSQPKPKVDSPKQEEPLDDTHPAHKNEELVEEMKNVETAQQNGECHMNESPVNMDLD